MEKKKHYQRKDRFSSSRALQVLNDLLQLLNFHLKEDRFHHVKVPKDLDVLQQNIRDFSLIKNADHIGPQQPPPSQKIEVLLKSVTQTLSIIATNAWRARKKMVNNENGEVKDEMKRVFRNIEAIFDALSEIGIDISDMQGRVYDPGMALKVISFEPSLGLSKEEIIETVQPTIAWKGKLIQLGEVIVGTPEKIKGE
jgi:hypothetical protein